MTSFTFTAEQLRLAPPEVRRWAVQEIAQALAAAERPSHDPSQVRAAALASCTAEEALHVFTIIRSNFVITQVFFELARDAAPGVRVPPLHPLNTGDILRHTRLAHGDGLLECFNVINEAFRQIRGAAEATLFGFDSHGHVYIHEGTHLSIRRLFEELVKPSPVATSGAEPTATPPAVKSATSQFATREDTPSNAARPPAAQDFASKVERSTTDLKGQTPLRAAPAATPVANPPPRQPEPSVREGPLAAKPQTPKRDQASTSLPTPEVAPTPTSRQRVRKARPASPSVTVK